MDEETHCMGVCNQKEQQTISVCVSCIERVKHLKYSNVILAAPSDPSSAGIITAHITCRHNI